MPAALARASDGTIAVESATKTTIASGFCAVAWDICCACTEGSKLLYSALTEKPACCSAVCIVLL